MQTILEAVLHARRLQIIAAALQAEQDRAAAFAARFGPVAPHG